MLRRKRIKIVNNHPVFPSSTERFTNTIQQLWVDEQICSGAKHKGARGCPWRLHQRGTLEELSF